MVFISSFAYEINVPVHFDTLANGLKIIVVPDTNVAVVSCRLYYFVGSMYEGPGTSGLSPHVRAHDVQRHKAPGNVRFCKGENMA